MRLLRGLLLFIVAVLLAANLVCDGWNRGFTSGYKMAMSEVALGIKDPDKYIRDMLWLGVYKEAEDVK